jgi:hypothetical protein
MKVGVGPESVLPSSGVAVPLLPLEHAAKAPPTLATAEAMVNQTKTERCIKGVLPGPFTKYHP